MQFFYIITHKPTGLKYAGARVGKKADPSMLMKDGGYLTSSKEVKAMIASDGIESFCIDELITQDEINIPFGMSVADYETWFLQTNDCAKNHMWLNKHNNDGINFASDEFKRKAQRSMLVRHGVLNAMLLPSVKEKIAAAMAGNKYGAKKRSAETKERMSKAFTGRQFSGEHRERIRDARTGTKASDATRQKMSESKAGIPRPQSWHNKMAGKFVGENNPMFGKPSPMRGKQFPTINCEYCGKPASKGNYLRWHGDNCKMKDSPCT